MKRFLLLLLLLLTVCSSAFAECNLNQARWKYLYSTNEYGFYFDTLTLNVNSSGSTFEVWECNYFPGKVSACNWPNCKEKGLESSEHYHYVLTEYDYRKRTLTYKSFVGRDNNGKVIVSYDEPSYLQKTITIVPDTIGEVNFLAIKKYIDSQKK